MRILAALLLAAASFAQEPLRVTTRLVQVTVTVRDKRGAVADLSKNDFSLFDKGKPRDIAAFHVAKAAGRTRPAALPPNTFTNRLDQQADPPVTATVILFDQLNTAFTDQAQARRQLNSLLASIDPIADATGPIAIYTLSSSLRIVHDFTSDPARLAAALGRTPANKSILLDKSQSDPAFSAQSRPDLSPAFAQAIADPLNAAALASPSTLADQILQPLQSYALDRRVAITFTAMQLIADRLSGLAGRKNLIWVSAAFPLSLSLDRMTLNGGVLRASTYTTQMQDAASAFDRAGIAVYPVDPRGLQVGASLQVASAAPRNQATQGTYNVPTMESMAGSREVESMRLLADWTGGRAFYNSNDLRNAIKQAIEDGEVTYTLGFYASEKDLDSTYHDLQVKVARKGTTTRYRKGYFATPLPAAKSESALELLRAAVRAPADATGIGLNATLAPNPAAAGAMLLALNIDLSNIRLEKQNDRWHGGVNFTVIQETAEGLLLDAVEQSIDIAATDAERSRLLAGGLTVTLGVTPAPGLSQIRLAVIDHLNANVGSLRIAPPRQP